MIEKSRFGTKGRTFCYTDDGCIISEDTTELIATRNSLPLEAGNGSDLQGFENHVGQEVAGAWRWNDAMRIGVCTEVDLGEARSVLGPIRTAFFCLFFLVVASAAFIIYSRRRNERLRRRIEEVTQLGQYTLEEKIGEGGMGIVYRASHALLRRPTAVKMLKPDILDEETQARFEREVQLTAQLNHPSTIVIYDYGHTASGIFYYAMELLPGITLAQLVSLEGAVPPGRAVSILRQIVGSLVEAHGIGLVHRDIKPLNVMINRFGTRADVAKLLDFGLVKSVKSGENLFMTAPHIVSGTPAYVPPERLTTPSSTDPRSDLYSVGAIAFNLLTGRPTFTGETSIEICTQVMTESPPRPSEHSSSPIPQALDDLVVSCLARKIEDRPKDAAELLTSLSAIDRELNWLDEDSLEWWKDNRVLIYGEGAATGSTPLPDAELKVDVDLRERRSLRD